MIESYTSATSGPVTIALEFGDGTVTHITNVLKVHWGGELPPVTDEQSQPPTFWIDCRTKAANVDDIIMHLDRWGFLLCDFLPASLRPLERHKATGYVTDHNGHSDLMLADGSFASDRFYYFKDSSDVVGRLVYGYGYE